MLISPSFKHETMPESPAKKHDEVVSYTIKANGNLIADSFEVVAIDVERAINRIGTAKITINLPFGAGEDLTFELSETADFALGNTMEIAVGSVDEKQTVFEGIIVNQTIRNYGDGSNEWVLRCSEDSVKMTLGHKSKNFANLKDSAVIASIISDHGLSAAVDSTDVTHKQLVQYQCNDWDFVLERAEANGLLVYMEDSKINVKKPLSSGSPSLLIDFETDVLNYDLGIDARHQLNSVTCSAWDGAKLATATGKSTEPTLSAQGDQKGTAIAAKFDANPALFGTSTPLVQEEIKNWADAVLLKSRMSKISGHVTFYGNASAKLNGLVKLSGFGARFNGTPMVSSIRHEVRTGFWQTTLGFGISPQWYHAQRPVDAPPAGGLLPAVQGLQHGVVLKISDDPDGLYRIKVDAPFLLGNSDGIWARLIQFYATSTKGSFFIPEVGDEVILGFLNGDPRYPVIIGSVYSTKNKPKYTPDAKNSIKAIVTKNDLKIELDDENKVITISTPAGNQFVLSDKNKSILLKDQSGNKVEMTSNGISLNSIKDVKIDAKGKISLSAVQGISLAASGGNVGLSGLNVEAKAQISASVQGSASAEIKSTGSTTVKGAIVMIN
jgi:Rhs element Vgr protein